MCEPMMSFLQFQAEDPTTGSSNEGRLSWGLRSKSLYDWLKKVGGYFHLSVLGKGHSESIQHARTNNLILPPEVRYEAQWWNREVRIDGPFFGEAQYGRYNMDPLTVAMKAQALDDATGYAHRVSIGNLYQLRNFLEVSITKSERPEAYIEQMASGLLVSAGRDKFCEHVQRICQSKQNKSYITSHVLSALHKKVITVGNLAKACLGFTRKRELLVPEWSDDSKLWEEKKN